MDPDPDPGSGLRGRVMAVNAEIVLPESPGSWVNEYRCVCGAHPGEYKKFNSGVSFGEAAQELRELNQRAELREGGLLDPNDPPGGFRSRGSVLYMARAIKMRRWYEAHSPCEDELSSDFNNWPEWAQEEWEEAYAEFGQSPTEFRFGLAPGSLYPDFDRNEWAETGDEGRKTPAGWATDLDDDDQDDDDGDGFEFDDDDIPF